MDSCIADLLDLMTVAIERGDWKVDGACDPDMAIERAANILRSNGWTKNGIDGFWQKTAY